MGQRSILCTQQMRDLNADQVQMHQFLPGPGTIVNSVGCPIAGIHPTLTSAGPFPCFDVANFPDSCENTMGHGNQYNNFQYSSGMQHVLGSSVESGFSYYPYVVPPFPLSHGSSDLSSSNNNNRVFGVNLNEFPRNGQFFDNGRGSCKRKIVEGAPASGHCYNDRSAGSSSSSSSVIGLSAYASGHVDNGLQQPQDSIEATPSSSLADNRGSGNLSTSENASDKSIKSISNAVNVDLGLAHHHGPEHQGNYIGQSFQPPSNYWLVQCSSNAIDTGNSGWNYAPPLSFTPGLGVGGDGVETTNMNGRGYMDATSNMNTGYINPSSPMPYSYQYHSPVQSMLGRTHGLGYPSQIAPTYHHPPTNLQYGIINPSHEFIESVSRHPGAASFSADVADVNLRNDQRASQASQGDINDQVNQLPSEDVRVVDYADSYDGSSDDEHRDMRMDIDNMSYEELLALEEQIGDVSTGLSEEAIAKCLKTRSLTGSKSISPNDSGRIEKLDEACTVCQVQFEENEMVGALNCGHEYHAECIRKWLLLKNFCPVCKTSAAPSSNNG